MTGPPIPIVCKTLLEIAEVIGPVAALRLAEVETTGLLTSPGESLDRLLAKRGRTLRDAMTAAGIEPPLSRWLKGR